MLALAGLLVSTAACRTTVGNYFANRASDLGDCFLVQSGVALGFGIDARLAGIVHANWFISRFVPGGSIGWVYGAPRFPGSGNWDDDWGFAFALHHRAGLHASYNNKVTHCCWGLLPAVFSWDDRHPDAEHWIWARPPPPLEETDTLFSPPLRDSRAPVRRWSRIHAFDVEVGVYFILFGVRVGFRPGELVDFLLGWIGVDLAGDDTPLVTDGDPPRPPPTETESAGRR